MLTKRNVTNLSQTETDDSNGSTSQCWRRRGRPSAEPNTWETIMSYRSLLVLLYAESSSKPHSAIALQLAGTFGAHISAFVPIEPIGWPITEVDIATAAWMEGVWREQHTKAERIAEAFRHHCSEAAFDRFDASVGRWPYIDDLLQRVYCSDLVVLTQPDGTVSSQAPMRHLTEELILHSAKPVLIMPSSSAGTRQFETVMLAWNESREAARAVSDALPFLKRASRVHVVSWGEHNSDSSDGQSHEAEHCVVRWLRCHGVVAEINREVEPVNIAAAILSRARDLQADLIVMGGYGHSRLRQTVLGGATRGILDRMSVPVLMSH